MHAVAEGAGTAESTLVITGAEQISYISTLALARQIQALLYTSWWPNHIPVFDSPVMESVIGVRGRKFDQQESDSNLKALHFLRQKVSELYLRRFAWASIY